MDHKSGAVDSSTGSKSAMAGSSVPEQDEGSLIGGRKSRRHSLVHSLIDPAPLEEVYESCGGNLIVPGIPMPANSGAMVSLLQRVETESSSRGSAQVASGWGSLVEGLRKPRDLSGDGLEALPKEELIRELRELRQKMVDHKNYEEEVTLQKNLLRSVGQSVICTDLQGTVTYWNRAAQLLYGWTEEEALGSNIMTLTPSDSSLEQATQIFAKLSEGQVWQGEFQVQRKDKSTFHAMVTDTPIMNESDQLVGVIGVSADISELKLKETEILRLNAELEARVAERTKQLEDSNKILHAEVQEHKRAKEHLQKYAEELETTRDKIERQSADLAKMVDDLRVARMEAESASRTKSRFLASMSHEIRTPMNGVIGMTNLILSTPLTEEQLGFIQTIKISGDSLLTIINDILDFSKIEAGEMVLEERTFNLATCLEDAMDLLATKAMDQGIELMCHVDESVPNIIQSDPARVRQVVVNLLSNAVKFTPSIGEIVLTASASLCLRKQSDRPLYIVHVAVEDTGIGIPNDGMDRLFKPFSQLDASTTRRFGGTGLGLIISRQLVELLGGEIWAESKGAGRGSIFNFTITVQGGFEPPPPVVPKATPAPVFSCPTSLPPRHPCTFGSPPPSNPSTPWPSPQAGSSPAFRPPEPELAAFTKRLRCGPNLEKTGTPRDSPRQSEAPCWSIAPIGKPDVGVLKGRRVLVVEGSERARRLLSAHLRSLGMDPTTVGSGREAQILVGGAAAKFDIVLIDMKVKCNGLQLAVELAGPERRLSVVLMCPYGQSNQLKRNHAILTAVMHKPIKETHLTRVLLDIVQGMPPDCRPLESKTSLNARAGLKQDLAAQFPLSILIAEDNLVNQKVATKLLERLGYEADVVANGLDALNSLRKATYDLVLMDLQMPIMDGIEATQRILADKTLEKRPRIVAMTANVLNTDRDACIEAGMDSFLGKPINVQDLTRELQCAGEWALRNR